MKCHEFKKPAVELYAYTYTPSLPANQQIASIQNCWYISIFHILYAMFPIVNRRLEKTTVWEQKDSFRDTYSRWERKGRPEAQKML